MGGAPESSDAGSVSGWASVSRDCSASPAIPPAIGSRRDHLRGRSQPPLGVIVAASSLLAVPPLGVAKQRLRPRMGSGQQSVKVYTT